MVRLKDIAERAGVSVMTVSKVLRNEPDISSATKQKVQQLADEMGYVPDALARGLRTRSTKLIGLVVPALTDPVIGPAVMAIEERAQEQGLEVILTNSLNLPDREEACLKRLVARRVDGLLVAPADRLSPQVKIYRDLRRRGSPTVIVGAQGPFCRWFANVATNDFDAGYEAARHLIDLGHRRIAFFTGPSGAPWAQARLAGYRRALRDSGIESEDRWLYPGGTTLEDGRNAALRLLNEQQSDGITAIQTVNDFVALGTAKTLMQNGCRIPEDLSVVGFGNILASEHFSVPLTTIHHPKSELGYAAMEVLIGLLGGSSPDNKIVPGHLVERASTASR